MPDALTKMSGEYLFTQGILGFTTFVLAGTVFYLYRQNVAQRKQYDADLVAERTRHNDEFRIERERTAAELAAERKLNAALQEERFKELKSTLATVQAVTDTVDAALLVLGARK